MICIQRESAPRLLLHNRNKYGRGHILDVATHATLNTPAPSRHAPHPQAERQTSSWQINTVKCTKHWLDKQ